VHTARKRVKIAILGKNTFLVVFLTCSGMSFSFLLKDMGVRSFYMAYLY
jgi:hypothetical protein